jgi:lysozyme
MQTSNKGVNFIKKYEGFKSKPYRCPAGKPTIGYGCRLYENGRLVTMQENC